MMRINDLAQAVGLSVQSIRNYESQGFLPPVERRPNGYRDYSPRHLQALHVARLMITGYGFAITMQLMQRVHDDDLPAALALIDARHAALHQSRTQVEATLAALRAISSGDQDGPAPKKAGKSPRPLSIRAAAQLVGVRVSAIRFWETQGLLDPPRDPVNGYRLYDAEQVRRLRVVVLLRTSGYRSEAIRTVLDQLAAGNAEEAITAAESRLKELEQISRRRLKALAAFWAYVQPPDEES